MFILLLSITSIVLTLSFAFGVTYYNWEYAKKERNEYRKKHRLDFSPR